MRRRIVPDIVTEHQTLTKVPPELTVREAARLMAERRIGVVMVVEDRRLVGIMSERDVLTRIVVPGRDPNATTVGEVMTRDPVTIKPTDDATDALDMMRERGFRHLPVVDREAIVGMVSMRDLYAAVHEQLAEDLHEREAYIFGQGYGATV